MVGFGVEISIPKVSGGWVGVDYHYTNDHSGPNPQVFPSGPSVAIIIFYFRFLLVGSKYE